MHEVLYILFVSYIQTTFGNVCMWIKLSRCRYYFSLTVLKSTELLCIFSPPLWLIEDRPWGAAHQLGPPGSLLPRRQVLPTQGDGEEALRPSAHPAAQTCSVRGRQTKRLWVDGWMDGWIWDQDTEGWGWSCEAKTNNTFGIPAYESAARTCPQFSPNTPGSDLGDWSCLDILFLCTVLSWCSLKFVII